MTYFGTDGIRGKVGESLPFKRAFELGYAIKKLYKNKKIMIAYDTRASYLDFTYALLHGLKNMDVEVLGMYPTPVLAYVSKEKDAVGVMITASHNPYTDNGLKLFEHGLKLQRSTLEKLESFMFEAPSYKHQPIKYLESHDIQLYLDFIESLNFKDDVSQYALFDCANGATSFLVPKLFKGMIMHHTPNGTNINLNCGSTYVENYMDQSKAYDLMVTYDGDGDRMLAIMDGDIIYGDVLLYLFAKADEKKGIKHDVALSIMTNPGILEAFESLQINVQETPVGDAYIIEAIQNGIVSRGAEASGHIITEHITIGDGILATYKLLDMISTYGIDQIKTWLQELTLFPMETKSLRIDKKVLEQKEIKETLNEIISKTPKPGKIIVRASGTEDLVRITVSLDTLEKVHHQIQAIETLLLGGKQ
jgi:phosphoglucosamine mutase